MSLATEIRTLRQKSLLTQTQFAEILHISFTSVNRWETGKAKPSLTAMKAIKQYCEEKDLPYEPIESAWLDYSKEVR